MGKITVTIPDTGVELLGQRMGFKDFLESLANNASLFGRGLTNARKGMQFLDALEKSNGSIEIEEDVYNGLVEAVDKPDHAWVGRWLMAMLPFVEHLQAAGTKKQEK